jgi:hypothetical protein
MQFAGRLQGNTNRRFFNGLPELSNEGCTWECKPFAAVALARSASRKNLQRVVRSFARQFATDFHR